jgi:hypothetical protein
MARRPRKQKVARAQPTVTMDLRAVPAAPIKREVPPREPIMLRLQRALSAAERGRRGAESEAVNNVIVGLSDAKQKTRAWRGAVGADVLALFDEIEAF